METRPNISPGTVSKILWHFTGGPSWNPAAHKQRSRPKSSRLAYKNLKSILEAGVLKLGGYREVVRVAPPTRLRYDAKKGRLKAETKAPITIESSPICCVSDIPAPHLRYHAYRYGKFAIGFHRHAIIDAGFNPVFYTLVHTDVVRSITDALLWLETASSTDGRLATSDIESEVDSAKWEFDGSEIDLQFEISAVESEFDYLDNVISKAKAGIENCAAFLKTFREDEFSTIYCEREWRSISAFNFDCDDIAMIVLPRSVGKMLRAFRNGGAGRAKLVALVGCNVLVERSVVAEVF